jgi:hypothetical protein
VTSGKGGDRQSGDKFAHWVPIVHFGQVLRKGTRSTTNEGYRVRTRWVAGLIAMMVVPIALAAQRHNSFETVAKDQLRQGGASWLAIGFAIQGDVRTAVLNAHEADTLTFRLSADSQYVIQGQCDRDCGDIDLAVHDSGGALIASDVTNDNHPWVTLAPKATGTYSLRVVMVSCSAEPCYYAIQELSRPAPPLKH